MPFSNHSSRSVRLPPFIFHPIPSSLADPDHVAGGITAVMFGLFDESCWWESRTLGSQLNLCNVYYVVGGLSILEGGLLIIWFSILAHKALHCPGTTPTQAYEIPVHRLLAGRLDELVVEGDRNGTENQYPFSTPQAQEEYLPRFHRTGSPSSIGSMDKKLPRSETPTPSYVTAQDAPDGDWEGGLCVY